MFIATNTNVTEIAVGMYNIIAILLFIDSKFSGLIFSVMARTGTAKGKKRLNGVCAHVKEPHLVSHSKIVNMLIKT